MTQPAGSVEVRTLVCAVGAPTFRVAGYTLPCGLRLVAAEDAARMLGRPEEAVRDFAATADVPHMAGWVALDWVATLARAMRAGRR